jgi:hypothetical protein
MARSETAWWVSVRSVRKMDWRKTIKLAEMQHIRGEKSYTHRLTDGMLDAPKGTGR